MDLWFFWAWNEKMQKKEDRIVIKAKDKTECLKAIETFQTLLAKEKVSFSHATFGKDALNAFVVLHVTKAINAFIQWLNDSNEYYVNKNTIEETTWTEQEKEKCVTEFFKNFDK